MSTEFRFLDVGAVEIRDDGSAVLTGVAMPYGTEARIGPTFTETVAAGAFGGDLGDVILNLHHDRAQPMARTGGGGLELEDSATALRIKAEIPAYRGDVVDMVKRRILRGLSVEMAVSEDRWTGNHREVRRAKLMGIGLVDRAAYTGASAELAARARYRPTGAHQWPLVL